MENNIEIQIVYQDIGRNLPERFLRALPLS